MNPNASTLESAPRIDISTPIDSEVAECRAAMNNEGFTPFQRVLFETHNNLLSGAWLSWQSGERQWAAAFATMASFISTVSPFIRGKHYGCDIELGSVSIVDKTVDGGFAIKGPKKHYLL